MLTVVEGLKQKYKQDAVFKNIILYFSGLNLTITNKNIKEESMRLTESICEEEELTFGGCNAAEFTITIADIEQDLNGQMFTVTQILDNNPDYTMPLGTYKVTDCKRQDNRRFKDITAYDRMTESDVDVSAWYHSLTFPLTIKDFRISLCHYLNYDYVDQQLINDGVLITKTIDPTYLKGRDVLKAVGEMDGAFGHFTRDNKFKYIDLSSLGLYPSETLYPAEDLYPREASETMGSSGCRSVRYEDYMVAPIDSLQIRQEEGDVGGVSGEGSENPYIIQGNFLTYGMDAATLKITADHVYSVIKDRYYRPHTTIMTGLPYLEVGDSVLVVMGTEMIESFVFTRTLTGIQSLTDEIRATGNQTRKNEVTRSAEIEQIKGKALKISKSVDALTVEMSDLEAETASKFEQTTEKIKTEVAASEGRLNSTIAQTAGEILTEVSNVEKDLNSSISQTAEAILTEVSNVEEGLNSSISQTAGAILTEVYSIESETSSRIEQTLQTIVLKVDESGNIAKVELGSDPVVGTYLKLRAENIDMEGYITVSDLAESGKTIINGDNIMTGTIKGIRYETIPSGGSDGTVITDGTIVTSNIGIVRRNDAMMAPDIRGWFTINSSGQSEISCEVLQLNGNRIGVIPSLTTQLWAVPADMDPNLIKFENTRSRAECAATKSYVDSASDERLKKEIQDLEDIEEEYMQLHPVSYTFKEDINREHTRYFGFLAQELDQQFPHNTYNIVNLDEDGSSLDESIYCDNGTYRIKHDNFDAMHVQMIQKQRKEINRLKEELAELKQQLKEKGVI